ncbi:MAG: hypothetical protein HN360_10595 [Rhodospirillaceae bacterium]|jgi:hypothetical protein|nr:hypothetical protein [Rhodospirillaceae bacterium]
MDVSTHFVFQHKVFSVPGCYFIPGRDDSKPDFATPMGESIGLVKLPALRREFKIADDSSDGLMLDTVERSLKFVDIIRVNDSIPNELLDGSASWTVGERHRLVARARLTLELVAWVTGKPAGETPHAHILQELEKPETRAKIKESIGKLTHTLGLGADGTDEVERRIDTLVHELSYIEGLRERLMTIHQIEAMVKKAGSTCSLHMAAQESMERVPPLLNFAYKKLDSEFSLLDKQNQNIEEMLRDMEPTIQLIRAIRDEIHSTLRIWDDLVSAWQTEGESGNVDMLTSLLARTHRFLAENYPIVSTW